MCPKGPVVSRCHPEHLTTTVFRPDRSWPHTVSETTPRIRKFWKFTLFKVYCSYFISPARRTVVSFTSNNSGIKTEIHESSWAHYATGDQPTVTTLFNFLSWIICVVWVSGPRHGTSSRCTWRRRVAANVLNTQLRTVDKGWSSSAGVKRGANN
jgi:hypothetical protein